MQTDESAQGDRANHDHQRSIDLVVLAVALLIAVGGTVAYLVL